MIPMHLLSVQILWMTFMRILMTTTRTKIVNLFDDMITDIITNKKI